MANYRIRVRAGRTMRVHDIHAADEAAARRLAARFGSVKSVKKTLDLDFLPGMTMNERTVWLYRMSSMVTARVPATEALKVMENEFKGQIKRASSLMLKRLQSGFTLVEAFEQDTRNFPPTTVALIRAGMMAGHTGRAFKDVANYERGIAKIRRGSMAKIYQALGAFMMAVAIMYYSTNYITPQILDNEMFKQKGTENYEWTRTLGNYVLYFGYFLTAIFAFLALLGTLGRRIAPNVADAIILRIPHFRDLALGRTFQLSLYRMGLLVKQGVQITEALTLAIADTPKGAMRKDLERALVALREGKRWPYAMRHVHGTDKAALATAEDAPEVSATLERLSEQHSELYQMKLTAIGPALQTLAAVFLTLSGALLFMQTMLPIMKLLNKISQ